MTICYYGGAQRHVAVSGKLQGHLKKRAVRGGSSSWALDPHKEAAELIRLPCCFQNGDHDALSLGYQAA